MFIFTVWAWCTLLTLALFIFSMVVDKVGGEAILGNTRWKVVLAACTIFAPTLVAYFLFMALRRPVGVVSKRAGLYLEQIDDAINVAFTLIFDFIEAP